MHLSVPKDPTPTLWEVQRHGSQFSEAVQANFLSINQS